MSYINLLLEIHCLYSWKDENAPVPPYCKRGVDHPGYHCVQHHCPFMDIYDSPHAFAYAGELGEVPEDDEYWIGFGGEMEATVTNEEKRALLIAKWKKICKEKIAEAYKDYMQDIQPRLAEH